MSSFFDNKARAAAAAAAASSSKSKADATTLAPRLQPWVEKYRPKNLDEIKSQDHVSLILKKMVNAANLPHLLLYGPPGTGKTSSILALCKELFPPDMIASRVLELNASDNRGLDVVRDRIKGFAQQAVTHAPANSKYPCPPFKIIILDEADSLTQDAQSALRRTMEIYSKTTRICFCCNYVSRIIDPIASRCSKFRFKSLDGADAQARVAEILKAEKVAYDSGVVERTLQICEGDLRRSLQLLQSAARLVGAGLDLNGSSATTNKKSTVIPDDDDNDDDNEDEEMTDIDTPAKKSGKGKSITQNMINEIAGVVPPKEVEDLITILRKGAKMNYSNIARKVQDLVADGWSATEMLVALYSQLIYDDIIDAKKKNRLTLVFSEKDKHLVDGAEEHLLLLDMACQIATVLAEK